jgi:hypothetical protein
MSTLKQIRDQVIDDLDLEEEVWVDDSELNTWINEAQKQAEAQIHTLYEDYFLVEADPVAIVAAQNTVDYPSDIYANKIRKIIFADGLGTETATHEVKRVKNLIDGKSMDFYNSETTQPILKWSPTNKASEGRKIRLFPSSGRAGYLYIWYIRNVSPLVNDTDVCEIDEFEHYIVQYVKTKVYLKDGDPRADDSKALEEQYKLDMIDTLSTMTPDGNNDLEMDVSFYEDSVGGDF